MARTSILKSNIKSNKIFIGLLSSTIILLILVGYLFYRLHSTQKNPQAEAQEEVATLVRQMSQLIVLPEDETPTLATVSDPEALKDQVFFAQAQKGDKVLIYSRARKAILYSPSLNKILEVAPLNVDVNAK